MARRLSPQLQPSLRNVSTFSANDDIRISTNNIIKGTIENIEAGDLLCTVTVRISCGVIGAVVVKEAFEAMGLSKGDAVRAIVKTNEIMLSA